MAYSDDYAIIGAAGDNFDCDVATGWLAGGTAVTPIVTNTDNRGGTASIEMRGTAGIATYEQDVSAGSRFVITSGTLNVWFRYSKGKGAAYLGGGATVVIRLYFGGTTDFADYQPLDNADEDLNFGWNLLQISGKNLNGGSTSGTWSNTDSNWDREIHRVQMRLDLQNANDKDSEDAPILMDSWFFGTKIIVSEGTPGVPVSIEDVETYSNDDTATHGGNAFPLGLVDVDEVFVNLKCGIEVGNGSDGTNNEGNLTVEGKFLLFNQWSEEVSQPITVKNFSTLQFGSVDAGTDGNYPVRGCQIVMPPTRPNDITVENGGTLKIFNSKIFRFQDIFLGAASDTGSTVELRGVAIDSCRIVYFRSNTLDLQDIEIYNNSGAAQCAEMIVSPDSCSNFLVHDCAQGVHFRATLTITEYFAQDNIGNDLAVLDGFEATLVSSVFDETKIGRLTS